MIEDSPEPEAMLLHETGENTAADAESEPTAESIGSYCEVYRKNSDVTMVAFGGLGHRVGQPMFEFRKALRPLNVNFVFFKDELRGWYHHPIDDFGVSFADKAVRIGAILDTIPASRRIFIGSSAGGFAALMYSRLIPGVEDCLLFGPQVFIDRHTRQVLNDSRWPKLIAAIPDGPMRNVSEVAKFGSSRTRIIVGDSSEEDMRHALFARSVLPADIHVMTEAGHNPAGDLKAAGVLEEVLAEFCSGNTLSDRRGLQIAQRSAQLRRL